jgi:hypothetical protein
VLDAREAAEVAIVRDDGLDSNDPIVYGLIASLVVYVGVSLATSPVRTAASGSQVTA